MPPTMTASPQTADDQEIDHALRNSGLFEDLLTSSTLPWLSPAQLDPADFAPLVRAVAHALTMQWPTLDLQVQIDERSSHRLYLMVPHHSGTMLTAAVDYANLVDRTTRGHAFLIALARRLLSFHTFLSDAANNCTH